MRGYEFYSIDDQSGVIHPYTETERSYFDVIGKMAQDAAKLLKTMKATSQGQQQVISDKGTIYLVMQH